MPFVQFRGVSPNVQEIIRLLVEKELGPVLTAGLNPPQGVIDWWFGGDARPGGTAHAEFLSKAKRMDDYFNKQCKHITFIEIAKNSRRHKDDIAYVHPAVEAPTPDPHSRGTLPDNHVSFGINIYVNSESFINNVHFEQAWDGTSKRSLQDQFRLLSHELSHRIIRTIDYPVSVFDDPIYGATAAKTLHQREKGSAYALNCAENWGFFYRDVWQGTSHFETKWAPKIGVEED